jgi:ubiquinone/menaquinone biosynthesis C-methylase UbiE
MTGLTVPGNVQKYDDIYRGGYDKSYPNLDLVRLEQWYFKNRPGVVLDYGFGTGANAMHMLDRGHTVVGLEASKESLALAAAKLAQRPQVKDRTRFQLIGAGESRLPLDDKSVDYVVCMSVLSLLESKERISRLIDEFHRVLKPDGRMIVDINGPSGDFASKGQFVAEDVFEYTLRERQTEPLRCYVPATKEGFAALFDERFIVDDIGWVGFSYAGTDEYEFLACVRKAA